MRPTSSRSLCLPPARTHFCELTAVGNGGVSSPTKYGLNGTIPATLNRTVGSCGIRLADGTAACPRSTKKSMNDWRSSSAVRGGLDIGSVDSTGAPNPLIWSFCPTVAPEVVGCGMSAPSWRVPTATCRRLSLGCSDIWVTTPPTSPPRRREGIDPLPRVARRQLGRAVLAPQGLHAGMHHRAGRGRPHQARVRQARREGDRTQRRPGGRPRALVAGHRGDPGPRSELPDDRRSRPRCRQSLRHDPSERRATRRPCEASS